MNPKKLALCFALICIPLLGLSGIKSGKVLLKTDWLIDGKNYLSKVTPSEDGKDLILSNGLIERQFRISPNLATVRIKNLVTSQNYLRSVRPEATITIDGHKHAIGGLTGQPVQSYLLPEWLDNLKSELNSFEYAGYSVNDIKPRFPWKKRLEWMPEDLPWPPKGIELILYFKAPDPSGEVPMNGLKGIKVSVHYEIYDGIPLICKWISLDNQTGKSLILNSFTSEIMAAVEGKSKEDKVTGWELPNLHVETDYCSSYEKIIKWSPDSSYLSSNYAELTMPCLLEVKPPLGPEQLIETGQIFESFRTWELFYDSYDRERKSLSLRRMYRTIAPWVTENPVYMHVLRADSASVQLAVDQCAEVGFEMVIMTFGSGFNMESGDPAYYEKMKGYAGYAHSKGIALGGYSLLDSRSISDKDDVINPKTGKTCTIHIGTRAKPSTNFIGGAGRREFT